MAIILLYRDEIAEGRLPPVCMRCGAPAVLAKDHTFTCHPRWVDFFLLGILAAWICGIAAFVFILVWVIVALATTVRLRVAVPLCQKHKNHWTWRLGYVYAGTGCFAIVGLTALAYVIIQGQKDNVEVKDLIGFLCVLPAAIGLAWQMSALVVQYGTIKAIEIKDSRITLSRVSPGFRAAMEAADAQEDEVHHRERRMRSGKVDEGIYDPETRGQYRKSPRDPNREDSPM